MKEAYFFTHDYNARQDPKLQEVLMDIGVAGIGIYWCIIEQLYEQGGTLPISSIKVIAFTLHANIDDVRNIIDNYGLFESDGVEFWSPAVSRRLDGRKKMSEKRSKAISKRWSENTKNESENTNVCKNDTNVSESDTNVSESDTNVSENDTVIYNNIKEKKRKEYNNNSLCVTPACASEEERERFLEIFTFQLNFTNPQHEVERFVAHYDASGWCRKDSAIPVKNKEALAKMWTPQVVGAKYPEEFRQWLFETYGKAKADDPISAALLLREVYRAQMSEQSGKMQVKVECTHSAAQAMEKYYSRRPSWQMSYRIPN